MRIQKTITLSEENYKYSLKMSGKFSLLVDKLLQEHRLKE
jgi:hypothetical protein